MARGGFPSMTALLGLLAVAGYQNRDKLSEMLGNRGAGSPGMGGGLSGGLGGLLGGQGGSRGGAGGLGGLLASLGGGAAGGGLGGLLGGGLGELSDRFRQNGHGETVDSWIGTGPNKAVIPRDLEQAIGPDVLDDLMEQTGLPRDELLNRLSRELPQAVDQYTPQGRLPEDRDFT
jgi:uncharacterized protein YidB (DUF937 family)